MPYKHVQQSTIDHDTGGDKVGEGVYLTFDKGGIIVEPSTTFESTKLFFIVVDQTKLSNTNSSQDETWSSLFLLSFLSRDSCSNQAHNERET